MYKIVTYISLVAGTIVIGCGEKDPAKAPDGKAAPTYATGAPTSPSAPSGVPAASPR